MWRKIKKFFLLSKLERKLFIEAFVNIEIIRLKLRLLPLKKIISHLEQGSEIETNIRSTKEQLQTAMNVGNAIELASNHTLFKTSCLIQALTAEVMLHKRDISGVILIGILRSQKAGNSIEAHAWTQCNKEIITGKNNCESYTVLSVWSW